MRIKKRVISKVFIELEGWEAEALESLLLRLKEEKSVSRDDLTVNEKVTGRRLYQELKRNKGGSNDGEV